MSTAPNLPAPEVLLDRYFLSLRLLNWSQTTIDRRGYSLGMFIKWFQERGITSVDGNHRTFDRGVPSSSVPLSQSAKWQSLEVLHAGKLSLFQFVTGSTGCATKTGYEVQPGRAPGTSKGRTAFTGIPPDAKRSGNVDQRSRHRNADRPSRSQHPRNVLLHRDTSHRTREPEPGRHQFRTTPCDDPARQGAARTVSSRSAGGAMDWLIKYPRRSPTVPDRR